MEDPYRLARFVDVQDSSGAYVQALAEIGQGEKQSHWMWFVFPQIAGLGTSPTAREFAITCRAEAEAYTRHPVLGPRLLECCRALLSALDRSAEQILGRVDAVKLRSSMTLFAAVAPDEPLFGAVLQRYFKGQRDEITERLLAGEETG
jgi:uncharacterized protein (DUF1810 family)